MSKNLIKYQENFATLNYLPGRTVYKEKLIKVDGAEYRIWDPHRSKLCGALKKGLKNFAFEEDTKVLYLGASTGTTISHLSDIISGDGGIYAVEISPQCMKSLLLLCQDRFNILPIHGDARQPQTYAEELETVDVLYQDVAQPDQDEILIKNAKRFLKPNGIAYFCVKSQSIDVTKEPKVIFEEIIKKLEPHFEILEKIKLEPYDKDHLFLVLKFKN